MVMNVSEHPLPH